jgi:predicted small lipoprotein YifL
MMLRIVVMLALLPVVSACGTKSPLLTPQCSKEEKAENAETAAAAEDADNVPPTPSTPLTPATPSKPSTPCGKQAHGLRNPSEPPNTISR